MEYEESIPNLEINMKKSFSINKKNSKINKNYLINPHFGSSQVKAYNFFNSINDKERKNKDKINNNIKANSNELGNIFEMINIENYKSNKYISIEENEKRKNNSIIVKKILDKIKRKSPKNKKLSEYLSPGPGDYSPEKEIRKEQNIRYRNLFIEDKLNLNLDIICKQEKDKFYKENNGIETFNIKNKNKLNSKKNIFNIKLGKMKTLLKGNNDNYNIDINNISYFDKQNKNNYLNISPLKNKKNNEERLMEVGKNILKTININHDNFINSDKSYHLKFKNVYTPLKLKYKL